MSQENLDVVQRLHEAQGGPELDAVTEEIWDPEDRDECRSLGKRESGGVRFGLPSLVRSDAARYRRGAAAFADVARALVLPRRARSTGHR
jgi:hypothetical protein